MVLGFSIPMMIRKGESMLLKLGRVSLLAALSMFVVSSAIPAYGQDEATATEMHEHADGTEGAAAGDHDDALAVAGDHAGGHGDPPGTPPLLSFDFGSAICNIAIFLGVFAILAKFVWPVILGGLKAREDKIHGDLEAAERANTEAKALLADYQRSWMTPRRRFKPCLPKHARMPRQRGNGSSTEAKAEAERQRERAIADIETAKKVALSELAGQTSDMAISVAKQVVGRELKAADHADLIRQSLEHLPSNN